MNSQVPDLKLKNRPGLFAFAVLLLVATPAARVNADATESADIIATVNGESVFGQSLERNLAKTHQSVDEAQEARFDIDRLLFRAINDVLIGQEARAVGLDEDPDIVAEVDEYRANLALKKLESVEIHPKAQVSEEEILALFEEQYARVTFHVLTSYEEADAGELLADLRCGADLEALAQEKSVDPYRLRKGLVDNIARHDLRRDMAGLVFSLEPGQLGGPIQTDLGWSVVRVDSFEEADPERLESVRYTVGSVVAQNKTLAARRALAAELRMKHEVVIDQKVVEAIQPEPAPDGRHEPSPYDPDAIIAKIGDTHEVTVGEYSNRLLGQWKRVRNIEAARASAPIVLNNLIELRLMEAEAEARGYEELPIVEHSAHAFETEILIPRYLQEVVAANIEISQEDLEEYYDQHQEEYHRPPSVRLAQISLETQEQALEIAEALRQGADVGWIARQHSTDGLAESGGDRGWYVPQQGLEDFNRDLFEAEIGTVLEPFGAANFWLVLKVTDRKDQGIYPLQEISGNIREAVFAEKFRSVLDEFIKTLRSRSEIEVNQEALQALNITGSQTEEDSGEHGGGHGH